MSPTPSPSPTLKPTNEPDGIIRQSEGELNRVVDFTDNQKQEERAIRRILNMTEGDIQYRQLHAIEEIYFVGTMTPSSLKGVEILEDGTVRVNGPAVKEGSVSNVNLIRVMPYLRNLALIKQPVTEVSGLSGLWKLHSLNLSCSRLKTLEGLSDLPSLYYLNITHTQVKDLTPLKDLQSLKTVTVSLDMLPLTMDPEAKYIVLVIQ